MKFEVGGNTDYTYSALVYITYIASYLYLGSWVNLVQYSLPLEISLQNLL